MSNYMVICPQAGSQPACVTCHHAIPHPNGIGCDSGAECGASGEVVDCVPVEENRTEYSMTLKDYIKLATALHNVLADDKYDPVTVAQCCAEVADVLASDNPRFSPEKFIEAVVKGVK